MERQYTDRRKVYRNCQHIGDVARFGDSDYRCSSHPASPRFATREQAERHLVAVNSASPARILKITGSDK